MRSFLILALIIFSFKAYPCDCIEIKDLKEARIKSYDRNALIFTARVIEANNDHYKLEVIEFFKGSDSAKYIVGKYHTSCSSWPKEKDGLWLIYTNLEPDGTIDISDCGISRSYRWPYISGKEVSIPPPPNYILKDNNYVLNDESLDLLDYEFTRMEYRRQALQILKEEIIQLRNWRDKN